MTFLTSLDESIVKHQSSTAISFFDGNKWTYITYTSLLNSAKTLEWTLKQCFRQKGVYIALYLQATQSVPAILYGVLRAHLAFLILDSKLPLSSHYEELSFLKVNYLLSNVPGDVSCDGSPLCPSFEGSLSVLGETVQIWKTGIELSSVSPIPMVYAIRTSGSTGKPKLIQVPCDCIFPNIRHLSNIFNLDTKDVILLSAPLTFDVSILEVFLSLINGATLCIVAEKVKDDPLRLLNVIFPHYKSRITFLQTTPSLFQRWTTLQIRDQIFGNDVPLKCLVLGGEDFPRLNVIKSWKVPKSVKLYNIYGLTEVSCWSSIHQLDVEKDLSEKAPIGEPLEETCFKFEDEESDSNIKHLLIGSQTRVCLVDDEGASVFNKECPVFRPTGDLFEKRGDHFFFIGRKDDVIKRWGVRVSLTLIESTANSFQGVKMSSCVHCTSSDFTRVYLFIVQESFVKLDKLKQFLNDQLPSAFMPDKIISILELPLSSHGKVNRKALLALTEKSTFPDDDSVFKKLWANYTTKDSFLLTDGFISCGGNSFSALQLCGELKLHLNAVPDTLLGFLISNAPLSKCWEAIIAYYDSQGVAHPSKSQADDEDEHDVKKIKICSQEFENEKRRCREALFLTPLETPQSDSQSCSIMSLYMAGRGQVITMEPHPTFSYGSRPLSLKYQWKYFMEKCVDASPVGVKMKDERNLVVIGSHSGLVAVLDLQHRLQLSTCHLPDRVESSACLSLSGKYYYVGCYDGCLYAIRINTGVIVWQFKTCQMIKSTPVILGQHVLFGSYDRNVYCVLCKDGSLSWKKEMRGPVLSVPQVENRVVYISTLGGSVAALNALNGSVIWEIKTQPIFSSPVISGDFLVFAEVDGNVNWINKTSGCQVRTVEEEGQIFSSLVVVTEGVSEYIVFGCHNRQVVCLKGGADHWRVGLDSKVTATPFYIPARPPLIAAASSKGTLYLLCFLTGEIVAQYHLPGEVFSSPIFIDGSVIVGCRDDFIYSLKVVSS